MDTTLPWASEVIAALLDANVAIPIIFATIANMVAIVKALTGNGMSLIQIADAIDAKVAANDTFGKAEIARLRASLES